MRNHLFIQALALRKAICAKSCLATFGRSFLVMTALWILCSGCVAALPAVIVATSKRVAVEYDPKEGVRSTAALAEEICSDAGGRAQFEATEETVAKYTCMQLTLPAVVSANPTQVAIEFDPSAGVNSTKALAESKCTEVGKQIKFISISGNIARYDCIESVPVAVAAPIAHSGLTANGDCNEVLITEQKSLSGFLLLGVPVTSAVVHVTDRAGQQVTKETVKVSHGGFFKLQMAAPLPEAFQVEARVTTSAGDTRSASATLRADVEKYRLGNLNAVILTPVTTLVSMYRDQHPGMTQGDAIRKVNRSLGIPPRVDPGGASAFSTVHVNPRRFRIAAEKAGGFDSIMAQMVAEIDGGEGATRNFADMALSPPENRAPDTDKPSKPWHVFKKPIFWGVGFTILGAIGDRMFVNHTKAKLDEITNQLEILNRKMDELLERIEDLALRNQYETRALILEETIDRDIRTYEVRIRRLIEENNDYVETHIDNDTTDPVWEERLSCQAKGIADAVKGSTDKALQQIHTVLMGAGQSGPSLITLWSDVSMPKRFIGDPYFDGLDDQFGYYQAVQADATYLLREAYEEGISPDNPTKPVPYCDHDRPPEQSWMCLHIDRSEKQEKFLSDREMFGKLIPERTVWDKAKNRMWTDRSVIGCEKDWQSHQIAADGFELGGYNNWHIASKEQYQGILDEKPEAQPAWDYLNARGFDLECGLVERANTRGYYSSDATSDTRAWVLGFDGSLQKRCSKQGECETTPYQAKWVERGALFNRPFTPPRPDG